jgi:arylsulfatase A-like enzyme
MVQGLSGGSEGLFTGRFALSDGYWNTGKGSNWEGGIREPAFAYWKGKISPFSRSAEIVSSLDVFPTLSTLAGIPMPKDRPFDGRDMSAVLLTDDGKSQHDFLFFYGTCNDEPYWSVTGVRHGKYKVRMKTTFVAFVEKDRVPANFVWDCFLIFEGTLVYCSRIRTI